ncbi:hypothetical protein GCM10010965_25660 [Caldalkalibacillus thermarum]|uniref:hypothetical protein n=1 Tax=Caldalkalibacillus thermarum TaxID=296745 RepID=UPI0016689471|nr:hypothetical protein [Caldalkalibacillus thermarum]GGK31688.1 hypothetical protein GCM10010965_25660 [Caldalkalibacillus thermarum]
MNRAEQLVRKYAERYQVSKAEIREVIESGIRNGMTMEQIEVGIKIAFGRGRELFSAEDIAKALCISRDEAQEMLDNYVSSLKAKGLNPADYGVIEL